MLTDPFTYIEKLVVGFDKRPTLHFSKFAFHSKAVGINVLSNIYCRQVLGKECKILTVLESSRNPGDIKKTGGRYTVIILNGFGKNFPGIPFCNVTFLKCEFSLTFRPWTSCSRRSTIVLYDPCHF